MRSYSDCYIAFVDLLGFKRLVNYISCEEIACIFDEINTDYRITINGTDAPWVSPANVKMKVMSDTICLYIESSETDALAKIIAACAYFQVRLMRLKDPILSRGAIVRNKMYAKDDITFGPGVIRAYYLEEKIAGSPRIILDNALYEKNYSELSAQGKEYIDTYTYEDYDYRCIDSLFLFYGLCHEKAEWKNFAISTTNIANKENDDNVRNKHKYICERFTTVTKKYLDFPNK